MRNEKTITVLRYDHVTFYTLELFLIFSDKFILDYEYKKI